MRERPISLFLAGWAVGIGIAATLFGNVLLGAASWALGISAFLAIALKEGER